MLTGDRLELQYRTWRWQRRSLTFDAPKVQSIAVIDSTWNGQLIGLGVGILGAWAINSGCDNESCIGSALLGVVMAPVAGLFIGQAIDRSTNRLIYIAPRRPIVTVTPLLTPNMVGVMARVIP